MRTPRNPSGLIVVLFPSNVLRETPAERARVQRFWRVVFSTGQTANDYGGYNCTRSCSAMAKTVFHLFRTISYNLYKIRSTPKTRFTSFFRNFLIFTSRSSISKKKKKNEPLNSLFSFCSTLLDGWTIADSHRFS